MPCGAGKTIVGLAVMEKLQTATLILATNTIAVRQWINEILDKTTLTVDQIGDYTGEQKETRPVTDASYQVLTYHPRRKKGAPTLRDLREEFPHFALFDQLDCGPIIYDEVHLLPALVFRITAEIQARRPRRRWSYTGARLKEVGNAPTWKPMIEPEIAALFGSAMPSEGVDVEHEKPLVDWSFLDRDDGQPGEPADWVKKEIRLLGEHADEIYEMHRWTRQIEPPPSQPHRDPNEPPFDPSETFGAMDLDDDDEDADGPDISP